MSQQSSGEKTEQPTPKKTRDARKKGQVARSQEVVTTASLISVIFYVWIRWEVILAQLTTLFDRAAATHAIDFRSASKVEIVYAFGEVSGVLWPILAIVLASSVASNYFQLGNLFIFENLAPKLEKIDPIKGFGRIFSKKQLFETFKSVLKIAFLSAILTFVLAESIYPYTNSIHCGLPCIAGVTGNLLASSLFFSALAFVSVAVFDFVYQRHHHHKSLMMTKSEVKREYKEGEGDPIVKRKRKELRDELLLADGVERTEKSTALVVNPTHFAVAISYDPGKAPLPIVVAKGTNLYAHVLRTRAELAGVPIFLNVPLARALYADAKIDEFVPDEWFRAIAEILAWVNLNRELLYAGPLKNGVIDMANGDHLNTQNGKQGDTAWDLE